MTAPNPIPRPLDHLTTFGTPSKAALINRDGVLSYRDLEDAVGRMAAALSRSGLSGGDRVASWLPKTRNACLLPLAAARTGLIHVPINPSLRRAQIAYILQDSGARMLISTQQRVDTLEAGDRPEDCMIMLDETMAVAGESLPPLRLSSHDPDELAAILYTSGSTGQPKGVMLSHANLWLGAISVAHYLKLTPDDRTLCVLPLSFDYGQNQLLSTWAAGGCAVPVDYMIARDVIREVERHDITTLAGVPSLWVQLLEAKWPESVAARLKRLTNSGGALTPFIINKLRQLFVNADIYPMYGLTEAFRSTYLDPSLVDAHPDSMGKSIPFAEIMVVRPDGSIANDGEPGELVHTGPLVAKGYWGDLDRTAKRFRTAPSGSGFGGLAVWSGDTVHRDSDGLLYFLGRDDEMIKVSGNRISPNEIEAAAIASGTTSEAVAVGVEDERLGQSIILVVKGARETEERLLAYFRAQLPAFMMPRQIMWRHELPHNANGKLDRAAIRAELLA